MAKAKNNSQYADYMECKAWQHHWDRAPFPPGVRRVTQRGALRIYWRCEKCGSAKLTNVNLATGKVFSTVYYRPDGWKEITHTRGEWKLEYIRQKRLGAKS